MTKASGSDRPRSGWGVVALALLPVACCGLPLLLTAVSAAGTGAVIGGVAGLALVAVATVAAIVAVRRRRACPTSARRR